MHTTLILSVSLLLNAAPPLEQGNLISNPSFEEAAAGNPAHWDFRVQRNAAPVLVDEAAHDGAHCVRMVDAASDGNVSVESLRIASRPGGSYTATAWFRTVDSCSPGIYLNFYDEFGCRVHHVFSRVKGPTNGWVQASVQATAPEEAIEASAMLYAYMGDVGTVDADQVTMTVSGGQEPGSTTVPRAEPGQKDAIDIGSRRELFVDDYIADTFTGNARRILHHPQPREVVLEWNKPWEGPYSLYVTVLHDGEKIRAYYRAWPNLKTQDCCAVAESQDGVHFTRPNLGLFEWEGSKENNICYMGPGGHNFTPFLDANPNTPPDQKWKAVASAGPKASLVPFVSADGYRWKRLRDEPIITKGAFDSQNLAYWNAAIGKYVEFHRGFRDGVRDIMTSTSEDFLNWTEPEWLDYGNARREHLYTNAITTYFRAPHIYLGFPCRFVPSRKKISSHKEQGVNDGLLMSSRDGRHFERWGQAFLRPGPDDLVWTDRCNYASWGIAQTGDTELSLYYSEHYRYPTARLRRRTIRIDGFVSIGADERGGEVLTRPLTFTGNRLLVNYATSAAGSIRFELCDPEGRALNGFSLRESEWLYGNEIEHTVHWGESTDVGVLAGQPVRLRIWLRDADLYSFQFAEQ